MAAPASSRAFAAAAVLGRLAGASGAAGRGVAGCAAGLSFDFTGDFAGDFAGGTDTGFSAVWLSGASLNLAGADWGGAGKPQGNWPRCRIWRGLGIWRQPRICSDRRALPPSLHPRRRRPARPAWRQGRWNREARWASGNFTRRQSSARWRIPPPPPTLTLTLSRPREFIGG